jgi:arginyl-tRNA synthetase
LSGYLLDVCHLFNQFYTKHRILDAGGELTRSRMVLVKAVSEILRRGLKILSVDIPSAM